MSPAHSLLSLPNLTIFPRSLVNQQGVEYALAQTTTGLQLVVLADPAAPRAPSRNRDRFRAAGTGTSTLAGFEGECSELAGKTMLLGPCNPQNAVTLRARLAWLQPGLLDLHTSVGMGDRVGLATPGHVLALRIAYHVRWINVDPLSQIRRIFPFSTVNENALLTARLPSNTPSGDSFSISTCPCCGTEMSHAKLSRTMLCAERQSEPSWGFEVPGTLPTGVRPTKAFNCVSG